jgi:hypothetical protein
MNLLSGWPGTPIFPNSGLVTGVSYCARLQILLSSHNFVGGSKCFKLILLGTERGEEGRDGGEEGERGREIEKPMYSPHFTNEDATRTASYRAHSWWKSKGHTRLPSLSHYCHLTSFIL